MVAMMAMMGVAVGHEAVAAPLDGHPRPGTHPGQAVELGAYYTERQAAAAYNSRNRPVGLRCRYGAISDHTRLHSVSLESSADAGVLKEVPTYRAESCACQSRHGIQL